MGRIKAVVFDLEGVYFEDGTFNFINFLVAKFGLTQEEIEDVYFHSERMQAYKRGEISGDVYWDYFIGELGIPASVNELLDLLISCYSVRPEMIDYIDSLKQQGIKTAICTNNFKERFERLSAIFRFDNHFDVIVTSFDFGMKKPTPEIFLHLSKQLGLEPEQIVMIDDKESNVSALLELGFRAFVYAGWDEAVGRIEEIVCNE